MYVYICIYSYIYICIYIHIYIYIFIYIQALQVSTRQHNSSLEQHTTEKDELRSALRRTEEQLDKIHSQVLEWGSYGLVDVWVDRVSH